VALFVLIVVGLVVAQTWLDWRETRKDWVMPEWAKGTALAGIVAVSLASATSFASAWMEDVSGQSAGGFASKAFWPQLAFLLAMLAIIVFALRKKKLRLMLLLAGCLIAFGLGVMLSS
jgi:hypothetical protein